MVGVLTHVVSVDPCGGVLTHVVSVDPCGQCWSLWWGVDPCGQCWSMWWLCCRKSAADSRQAGRVHPGPQQGEMKSSLCCPPAGPLQGFTCWGPVTACFSQPPHRTGGRAVVIVKADCYQDNYWTGTPLTCTESSRTSTALSSSQTSTGLLSSWTSTGLLSFWTSTGLVSGPVLVCRVPGPVLVCLVLDQTDFCIVNGPVLVHSEVYFSGTDLDYLMGWCWSELITCGRSWPDS